MHWKLDKNIFKFNVQFLNTAARWPYTETQNFVKNAQDTTEDKSEMQNKKMLYCGCQLRNKK